jgi:ATP-dependent DNA ligase
MCSTRCRGTQISAAKMDQAATMRLVDEAPTGAGWLHEIKYDGYRMHAHARN